MPSTRAIDLSRNLAESPEAAREPLGVAAGGAGPALESVGNVGDVGLGGALSVGKVAEVDAARVVATSSLVRVALGGSGILGLAVLAEPLDVSGTDGSTLGTVADHLQDGAVEVIGVEADGASEGLHETAVLDTVVGAGDMDIAGRLGDWMLVIWNAEIEKESRHTSCIMTAKIKRGSTLASLETWRIEL